MPVSWPQWCSVSVGVDSARRAWLAAAASVAVGVFVGCKQTKPAGLRIISTAPSMTEVVFALGRGSDLVGRTSFCDYPSEAASVEVIGGFADPNLERILALAPTLVCGERGPAGQDFVSALDRQNIKTFFPAMDHVEDIADAMAGLGALIDARDRGAELAAKLREDVAAVGARYRERPRTRAVMLFDWKPLVAAGKDSFPNELLDLAHGENAASGAAGKYPRLSPEGLLSLDPDVLIDGTAGAYSEPALELARSIPGLAALRAMRTHPCGSRRPQRCDQVRASQRASRRSASILHGSGARARTARIDQLLVERGLVESRAKAQAAILAGEVFVEGARVDKAGQSVDRNARVEVVPRRRFVSRGGEKLEGALVAFGAAVDVRGVIAVDVGASTGGFTDCLLQRGAAKVYAVDVGRGQLDGRLRGDARVVVREGVNARELVPEMFAEPVTLVVVDASFIGLDKLLPAIARVLAPGGVLIALVKPQFEAGREAVSRGRGVIRDDAVRDQAIAGARAACVAAGFEVSSEVDSALPGPKGNRERFLLCSKRGSRGSVEDDALAQG
ncbi:MAG: TlyA family rRNA (cytidine-2'-O)-methyltransferase [Polyangiaceae bacterium]